ncbi:MAG: 4Fe-4S binding protein, partial [Phycisphaerae bacterium]
MAGWQSKPGPRRETGKSASPAGTLTLPVVGPSPTGMRRSQMSRWRALSLVGVHVLIIAHIAHWLVAGRTLSPVEPSEAMYTLNDGHLNAGFIFFAVSLLATLVLGRFVCGWGCHLVAYQDLCAWLLKKIGLKPKPFRSRIVIMAPFALAVYMFIWPSAYRLWMGIPRSPTTNHLMTGDFWATFPGPVIGVVSVLVCGFIIVYFLGSKGFCTYACPYGGFFRVADRFAPGRILVSDACEHCGHCTATCSSNVRVHEEVARYGMVVDPGCMKCMDCVSVCPNHALHFGFEKPSLAAKPRADVKTVRPYDFNPVEELMMVVGGVGALLALRGLYGQIPLLLAMALAAVTAYLGLLLTRMVHAPNVKLQRITFKRGGRWSRAGAAFGLLTASWTVLVVHGGVVQYHLWRGQTLARSAGISDEIWFASSTWWDDATEAQRKAVTHALRHFELVDSLGLLATPVAVRDSVRLHLAMGDDKLAEAAVRRLIALRPDEPDPYRGLAGIMRKTGRRLDAEASYRRALSIKPSFAP